MHRRGCNNLQSRDGVPPGPGAVAPSLFSRILPGNRESQEGAVEIGVRGVESRDIDPGTEYTLVEQALLEQTLGRAYLAAHLFTASAQQAEDAILEAVDWWDAENDDQEDLFRQVLETAARQHMTPRPPIPNRGDRAARGFLPPELRSVLRLPAPLRRCLVLRVLAGLSRPACARMLRLRLHQVDEYTCAALKSLPTLAAFSNPRMILKPGSDSNTR